MDKRTAIIALLAMTHAVGQERPRPNPVALLRDPVIVHADLPLYPAVALAAHLSGPVDVTVRIENGTVIDARASGGTPFLEEPSLKNARSWRFQGDTNGVLHIRYVYRISGKPEVDPGSASIRIRLPNEVLITSKPVKPTQLH